jgi:glycosyltransferase involved in cell wall biosynthesis
MINNKKTIALKVWTTEGNAEGFQSDIDRGRFWDINEWRSIVHNIVDNGYCPMFVGINNEDGHLREYCDDNNISYLDGVGLSVEETIELLKQVEGGIFCNSWEWELTSRMGIPTVCFYTKNHFFIANHTPSGPSEFWDTCYIETNPVQTDNAHISGLNTASERLMKGKENADDVWFKMDYMLKNKKRPEVSFDTAMITFNDIECVQTTLDNVRPYIVNDFIITDGGSTDGTLNVLKQFQSEVGEDKIKVLNKKWDDSFDIQKNNSLDGCESDWIIWIDADEFYEPLLWNQLPWYITSAERNGVDCINVPRINTIIDITPQQLYEMAKENNWGVSYFGWVSYPDYQQRVFKKNCRFAGRTHERIVGMEKESALVGVHCIHPKKKARQDEGIKREERQFKLEASNTVKRINVQNASSKKVIMHYVHHLGLGGTAKAVHLLGKYLNKHDKDFHHVVAYKVHGEMHREKLFEESFGRDNMIPIASIPEFYEVVREVKPFIMHRQAAGIAEFPFCEQTKKYTNHFISTSIFGYVDRSPSISRVVYISNYMQHHAGKFGGDKVRQIGIMIEPPYSDDNLREELGISQDAFVFGRVGRDDSDIFDAVNLTSYSRIENDNTCFICLSPSEALKNKAEELGIKNIKYVEPTIDDVKLSKFYNTLDVLAHARLDGECNPGNIREAFAHGKPVISHYAVPYNGHIGEIGNCGFVVGKTENFHNVWQNHNPSSLIDVMDYSRQINIDNFTAEDRTATVKNNVDEYTRIMRAFVDGTIDYKTLSDNCIKNWKQNSDTETITNEYLTMYKELI